MGSPSVISTFTGEHEALSNFHVGAPLILRYARGQRAYPSGEHMFQAFKATSKADHERLVACATPLEARAAGKRYLRLRGDWERVKLDVMRLVLSVKFQLGREEAKVLLATGDALLVEGTTWADTTWGVDLKQGRAAFQQRHGVQLDWEPGEGWEDAPGRNWLGTLLMARRAELAAQLRDPRPFGYDEVARVAMTVPPAPPMVLADRGRS